MALKKYVLPGHVEAKAAEMEKKRWYKMLKLILWAFGLCLFLFFNADDIWEGIKEYETSAKDKPMA